MSPTIVLALPLVIFCVSAITADQDGVTTSKQLAEKVQKKVLDTKKGTLLSDLQGVLGELKGSAIGLLNAANPSEIECGTNLVIKMAAAATGSHEVLSVLFANGTLSALGGQLSMALAMLDLVAQQLLEQLIASNRTEQQLSALIVVLKATQSIVSNAEQTVSSLGSSGHLRGGFYRDNSGVGWRQIRGHEEVEVLPESLVKRTSIFDPTHRLLETRELDIASRVCVGISW